MKSTTQTKLIVIEPYYFLNIALSIFQKCTQELWREPTPRTQIHSFLEVAKSGVAVPFRGIWGVWRTPHN